MAANWTGRWLGSWVGRWLGALGYTPPPAIVAFFRMVCPAQTTAYVDGRASVLQPMATMADDGLVLSAAAETTVHLQCPPDKGAGW